MKKLSDVVAKENVKNTKFNTLKTNQFTTLIHINQYNIDKQSLQKTFEDVDKKVPEISGFVTSTVLNTKISYVKNKIPAVSDLVKKIDCHVKIVEIEGNYIVTFDYNKFTTNILDAKLKQKQLVNKYYFSSLPKYFDLNTRLKTVKKAELKAEHDKIMKLQTYDLSFAFGKSFFSDDRF